MSVGRRRGSTLLAALSALVLVASACSAAEVRAPRTATPSPLPRASPSPSPAAPADPGADPLCRLPGSAPPVAAAASVQEARADVRRLAREVEEVREVEFRDPVIPEAVSREEIAAVLEDALDQSLPGELAKRRERAWATIGVLPEGTNLRRAVEDLLGTQTFGLYEPATRRLMYLEDGSGGLVQRFVLAHELVHALEDQVFDLSRLYRVGSGCEDDEPTAFLSLVEGSATLMSLRWASRYLSPLERLQLQQQLAEIPLPSPSSPPFLLDQLAFPYIAGQQFVQALLDRGGPEVLDEALERPPASTEQILHPDRYPDDVPERVWVESVSDRLGREWTDLDLLDVGEGWLLGMLSLRLDHGRASVAAEGWDGGQYRALGSDSGTAVVMRTIWDSPGDAKEFAEAVEEWLGDRSGEVRAGGSEVEVLFASDPAALEALAEAVASLAGDEEG